MVQLKVLSGKMAGGNVVARRFPVHIGRAPTNQVRLDDPGVWDSHARLTLHKREGYFIEAEPNALLTVNGTPAQITVLRNGDEIGLGSARLQFWLAETTSRGLKGREMFTWFLITVISLTQVALVYYLIQL
jgi:pSer/pThr/pTyr-binding forkhead associated (FHA) protein